MGLGPSLWRQLYTVVGDCLVDLAVLVSFGLRMADHYDHTRATHDGGINGDPGEGSWKYVQGSLVSEGSSQKEGPGLSDVGVRQLPHWEFLDLP